jgi:hypothetical protein
LRRQDTSCRRTRTWLEARRSDYKANKKRVLDLYALADGKRQSRPDDPDEVICLDEFSRV